MCLCECAAAQIKETARETYEGGRKFKGGGLKRDTTPRLLNLHEGISTVSCNNEY